MAQSNPVTKTPWGAAGIIVVAIGAFAIYASVRQGVAPPDAEGANPALRRNQTVVIGGISRPKSDVSRRESLLERRRRNDSRRERNPDSGVPYRTGQTPRLAPDANPTVASAYEALTADQHPERLSVLLPPSKFDPESYARDPAAYLEKFEPGRVWQTAQPGPDTPAIKPLVASRHFLAQGESVRLKVKTAPNAPVTFTSMDLGAFENQLPSITVAADETGEASATFTSTPGTIFRTNVLAASPVAAGQAQFQVWTTPPAAE